MQNPYHMTETVTEKQQWKEDSTGYDNSLKLKNSGVNQSWNNVMLQNVFVLRRGGKGGGSDGESREEVSLCFSVFPDLKFKMHN